MNVVPVYTHNSNIARAVCDLCVLSVDSRRLENAARFPHALLGMYGTHSSDRNAHMLPKTLQLCTRTAILSAKALASIPVSPACSKMDQFESDEAKFGAAIRASRRGSGA